MIEAPATRRRDGPFEALPQRGPLFLDSAMLALSALAPACLAAAQVGNVADAAHDSGTARVLGLDPQPWRALDVAAGVLLAALPVGTHAARAAMGGAVVLGGVGAVLYVVTRRLLGACAEAPWLGSPIAAIATLSALTAPAWQLEAAAAGGAVTGGLLVLLPVALLTNRSGVCDRGRWGVAALSLGLAVAQEPLVGACAFGGIAAFVIASRQSPRGADWRLLAGALLSGAAPLLVAMARTRASGASLFPALTDAWAGERGSSMGTSRAGLLAGELGGVTAALGLGGILLAMLVARARPLASALGAVAVLGMACAWGGAPAGPARFGPSLLAATAAASALAGVSMQAIVRAVAAARMPFARSTAAMVLALALALPVEGADEALVRSAPRAGGATAIWDDVAWGALPPRTVVLLTDPRVYARALAARAIGSLRGDVTVVPTLAGAAPARGALVRDPALLPLWRDLELVGVPTEQSLSSLASARPLAMAYEPRWGHALGGHFVPLALFDRFVPEPRGASDRRRALEAFTPQRARLADAVARDPELADATSYLLGAREDLLRQLGKAASPPAPAVPLR
jgi:hypothetical protein